MCDSNSMANRSSPSTRPAFADPKLAGPRLISMARTAPSAAFAARISCFLFLDATQRISKVDKQLCDYISQNYKPCILVVNKWDTMAKTMTTDKWVRYLARFVPHDALCADRFHHGTNRQKREGPAEPWPDAVQAIAVADSHGATESTSARCRVSHSAAHSRQSSPEDLLRHASRRAAPDAGACFAAILRGSNATTSATCWARSAINCISKKCRSSSTCANVSRATHAMKSA